MRINVTASDCLNQILSEMHPKETFVPFREAMVEGPCSFPPFSDEFLAERAYFHNSSLEDYKKHMAPFLELLDHLSDYSEIVLWFGDEPFCKRNTEVVIDTLRTRGFQGSIVLNIVNEETGVILRSKPVHIFSGQAKIKTLLNGK